VETVAQVWATAGGHSASGTDIGRNTQSLTEGGAGEASLVRSSAPGGAGLEQNWIPLQPGRRGCKGPADPARIDPVIDIIELGQFAV
jgi:hypothetical protein